MSGVESEHGVANFFVGLTGVAYFTAWSASFYPQLIKNARRRRTGGLSADFAVINPIGFLALTIWNWGVHFSPVARKQYQSRHHGHQPQISTSDLAFCLHALILSTLTLLQVIYYTRKNSGHESRGDEEEDEGQPLLKEPAKINYGLSTSTLRPSLVVSILVSALLVAAIVEAAFVWAGRTEFLDWLYFVSTIKIIITTVKYIPQVLLNFKLKNAEGYAIGVVTLDLIGSFFSFAQLVISSIWVEGDPSGIIANPAKLGMSFVSVFFNLVFVFQRYVLYAPTTKER